MPKPRPPIPLLPKQGTAPAACLPIRHAMPRQRLPHDLEEARRVQESFLPEQLPQVPGYEFYAYYESAHGVGGDYCDFVLLPPDQRRLAIIVADVVGKGLAAALLMARFSSEAPACFLSHAEPAAAITALNNLSYQYIRRTDRFVTVAAAVLDPTKHTLTLVNAGHPAPLIHRRATGALEETTTEDAIGLPLGIDESIAYRSHQVELQPGDCVLLYSDGVTDQVDEHDAQIQQRAFQTALMEGHSPRTLGDRIVKILEEHASGRVQDDDITIVSFGRIGN